MKKFLEDFKTFIARGNVVDMAVGMMIGSAFGKIVTSLVNDIVMPLISLLIGSADFSSLKILLVENGENSTYLAYVNFIQNVIDFLIIAFCIFCAIRIIAKFKKPVEPVKEEAPKDSDELIALKRIVELLENKK